MNSGTNTHFVKMSLSPDEEDAIWKNIVQLFQVQVVNFGPEQGQILLICKLKQKTKSESNCITKNLKYSPGDQFFTRAAADSPSFI
jgi:hypothetical protein